MTEVLLCSVPSDILPPAYKQQLLLDLLQTLLNKVLADGTMPDLANQVSGVVLLLLTALMQTYDNPDDALNPASGVSSKPDNYISMLDSTRTSQQRQKTTVYSTALQVILKGLIMWISNTSKSMFRCSHRALLFEIYVLRTFCT